MVKDASESVNPGRWEESSPGGGGSVREGRGLGQELPYVFPEEGKGLMRKRNKRTPAFSSRNEEPCVFHANGEWQVS